MNKSSSVHAFLCVFKILENSIKTVKTKKEKEKDLKYIF